MNNLVTCRVCCQGFYTMRPLRQLDGGTITCPHCWAHMRVWCEYGKETLILPECDQCLRVIEEKEEFARHKADVLCPACAENRLAEILAVEFDKPEVAA